MGLTHRPDAADLEGARIGLAWASLFRPRFWPKLGRQPSRNRADTYIMWRTTPAPHTPESVHEVQPAGIPEKRRLEGCSGARCALARQRVDAIGGMPHG
jgi:hypothetical protein